MSDWLTYAGYRLGAGLVGILPGAVVIRLGSFGGWLSWMWSKGRREMAIRHMARVLGPDADHEKAARAMFSAYGRYWAETFWFRPRRVKSVRRHITVHGGHHLAEANAAGRPIVAAIPHLGNWEMAASIADDVGVRVTAVAEALANRLVLDWFMAFRNSLNIDILLAEKGASTMRGLLAALKDGQLVALVADRDIPRTGTEVSFFGETTTLPSGPAALALRTDAALVPVASYFKKGRGHVVVISEPLVPLSEGTRDEKVADLTQQVAHAFEDLIRREPTQWHLVQPNWPSDFAILGNTPRP